MDAFPETLDPEPFESKYHCITLVCGPGGYDTFAAPEADRELRNAVLETTVSRAGNEFHGAAGLSVGYSAYTTLHKNEIRHMTYTGISVGWGWTREPDTYAANNTISNNYVHNIKLQEPGTCVLGDGGGIYLLGPQQGSVMKENHIANLGGNGGGAIYPDQGSAYWDIADNVFSNASFCVDDCRWLHIWQPSIHDITVRGTYTDTATLLNNGNHTPVTGTVVVNKSTPVAQWPKRAVEIMDAAGPENAAS